MNPEKENGDKRKTGNGDNGKRAENGEGKTGGKRGQATFLTASHCGAMAYGRFEGRSSPRGCWEAWGEGGTLVNPTQRLPIVRGKGRHGPTVASRGMGNTLPYKEIRIHASPGFPRKKGFRGRFRGQIPK